MTSYLLAAPRFLIHYPQRIMWRPSREKGPRDVLADPLAACLVEYGENLAKKGGRRSAPLSAPPLPFGYPAFGTAPVPFMLVPTAVQGPEDMLSSPFGQNILSYEPPHGFAIPPFAMYDGSSDPYDHMMHFNQAMILSAGNDRLLCNVFPTSLKGPALA